MYASRIVENKLEQEIYLESPPQVFRVQPIPIYRVFISQTVREQESFISRYISREIEKWGFNGYTIGLPPFKGEYSDDQLLRLISNQIQLSDVVFGIATKRDQLNDFILWKTTEWVQSETAIGYALNSLR